MNPTRHQQRVIDSTDRDIMVTAAAGSGKTWTTVRRYVRLISEKGYRPNEILAFTFTDRAAADLRRKVREAVAKLEPGEPPRGAPGEDRQEPRPGTPTGAEAAAEHRDSGPEERSMSSAWIGTFHAICSRILKAHPVEAGVDPGFTVLDEITAETLRSRAFRDALEAFLGEDQGDARRERLVGMFTEYRLRQTVFALFDELRSRGVAEPKFPEFPDTAYPTGKIEHLRREIGEIAGMKGLGSRQRPAADALKELLADPGRKIELEELGPLAFPSKSAKLAGFCEVLAGAVVELAAHEQGDAARRDIGRLLELFGRHFTRLKAGRGLLDYEDLQLVTLALLENPRHRRIQNAYRKWFREIMVDEYQDTNRLQSDLVKALRGEGTTLMTIGDEMQSIYGFRHADIELFQGRVHADGVTSFPLTDNFRSLPEVIAAVNEIGGTLDCQLDRPDGADGGPVPHTFTPLTVGRDDPDLSGSATVIATGHNDWKPLDLGELAPAVPPEARVGKEQDHFHQAEALRLAHHLRELVDSKKARQKDIAILLRATTRADIYVKALERVGLTPYMAGGKGFWNSREAVDLRSLLSVIANPLEDDALLGALVSPACGLSSDALWLLRRAAPPYRPLWPTVRAATGDPGPEGADAAWLEHLPEADRDRLNRFVATTDRLRLLAKTIPLASLVEKTVTATGYDLANLIRDPSRNGMANVRRIASLADEYETAEGRDLRGFLDWVQLSADLNRESAASTEDEASEVIRIMTVHAAKGLQFKVVCVPDCGRQITERYNLPVRIGRSKPDSDPEDFEVALQLPTVDGERYDLFGWPKLADQARDANLYEELRLFHVALTRAEDHLVISGVLDEKPKHEVTPSLSTIGRFCVGFGLDNLSPDDWPASVPEGPEPDDEILLEPNFASEERAAMLSRARDRITETDRVEFTPPPIHRPTPRIYPDVPLSFTAIHEYEECPARFFAGRILRLEDPERPGRQADPGDLALETVNRRDHGTRFGSAVHDVLELLGRSRWGELREETLAAAFEKRGVQRSGLISARRMIEGFRDSDLGRRLAASTASFEEPLLVRVREVTIRGFADVLLDDRIPLVLDYKTNRLGEKTPAELMADYAQQRNLYALAVARARGVDTVETAFVFLERPGEPVLLTMGPEELDRAEAELGATLEDITAGRFFGGPDSHRQPCGECWGCMALAGQIARASEPR